MKTNFMSWNFVNDIISRVGLGFSGQGYQDLGPKCMREVFRSRFY